MLLQVEWFVVLFLVCGREMWWRFGGEEGIWGGE